MLNKHLLFLLFCKALQPGLLIDITRTLFHSNFNLQYHSSSPCQPVPGTLVPAQLMFADITILLSLTTLAHTNFSLPCSPTTVKSAHHEGRTPQPIMDHAKLTALKRASPFHRQLEKCLKTEISKLNCPKNFFIDIRHIQKST